jgi:hypothetical protein
MGLRRDVAEAADIRQDAAMAADIPVDGAMENEALAAASRAIGTAAATVTGITEAATATTAHRMVTAIHTPRTPAIPRAIMTPGADGFLMPAAMFRLTVIRC